MKFSEMPYERVDLEKLKADFAALERDFDAAGSGEEQFRVHQRYYAVTGHAITEMTIAEIRHDIDMTDEFYREEQKYCDEIRPVFQNLCVSYQKKLYASPYRAYLESVIGPVAFRNMELEAKSVDPRIIPLMQEENRLQDAYNHILATAKIDWNGETLNLSLLEPYLRSADRRTRIEAYAKRDAVYLAHAEDHDHDLRIDRNVLRQEHVSAGKVGALRLGRRHLLCERLLEFFDYAASEQGLRNERVNARLPRFMLDLIPVVGCQDDYGSVVTHYRTDLARGFHAVHLGHLPVNHQKVVVVPARMAQLQHLQCCASRLGNIA